MLSASTTPDLIEEALRRGASAYVLKTVDPTDLPSTLRQVIGGTVFSTVGQAEGSMSSGAKLATLSGTRWSRYDAPANTCAASGPIGNWTIARASALSLIRGSVG